jgi:hypothetical protein
MKSSCEEVRALLWGIKSWAQCWSPIHTVEILYDDGFHQDFAMFLEWQASDTYIRTVRFLDGEGDIVFFSPKPPPPMTTHHGKWQLTLDEDQDVELTAIRWFELPLIEKETQEEYQQRLKNFSAKFVERLEHLLKCLEELCEKSM